MEQKVAELEAKVAELEEVVKAMGRLMMADQPAPTTQETPVPNDISIRTYTDVVLYLRELGYKSVAEGIFMSPDKTVKAQVIMNRNYKYDIHFSRV